uniref:Uncharacterized protein n=1 Tax=Anguilla anguilla TaxID=7936 RepID=A0A0E9W2C8_ANGAN
MTVVWDIITRPGVWAVMLFTLSGTIMRTLESVFPPPPE